MQTRKERKFQIRESVIIEAAARLIEQVGYSHLTMDMLSEEAGIAKATLYQHFKDKEDVFITSTMRALERLEAFMLTNTGTAIQQLEAIMRYMMLSSDKSEGFPTMIMHDEVLHLFNKHETIGAKFRHLNDILFQLINQAKADKDIADDLPNEVIVTMMMNAISISNGQIVYSIQPSKMAEYTLRIFFNGLKA